MTEAELRAKEKELATQEEELQAYAREILDREHALRNAEKAKRPDVERTDYLFDRINADNRKLVLEIPTPVQIQQPETNHIQAWIFAMATMAAVFSLVAMILALF